MKNTPGYLAIKAESDRLKLPTAFRTDLTTHDRRFINANPGKPFVWIPREHGTFVCRVTAEPIDGAGNYVWHTPGWHKDLGCSHFYVWSEESGLQHYPDAETCAAAIRDLAARRYRVLVHTPDGERPVEPILRRKEDAEGIRESMERMAVSKGWNLTYRVEEVN